MDHAVTARIEAICDELGLDRSIAQRMAVDALVPELEASQLQVRQLKEENQRLTRIQSELDSSSRTNSADPVNANARP